MVGILLSDAMETDEVYSKRQLKQGEGEAPNREG